MKNIKLILSTFSVVIICFGMMLFVSCDKSKTKYNDSTLIRPCDNVICLNGGTCTNGICNCPQGYEGDKCGSRWSEKFVGNYIAADACYTGGTGYYNVSISGNSAYAYKINLMNAGVFCPNSTISADINPEKTTFSIPMQNTCGGLYLSGYGNMSGTFINIYLKSRDTVNHVSASCSIVLSKQ